VIDCCELWPHSSAQLIWCNLEFTQGMVETLRGDVASCEEDGAAMASQLLTVQSKEARTLDVMADLRRDLQVRYE
jgi:hypothetical protein